MHTPNTLPDLRKRRAGGFTLMEMLIVIAIIAILVAIAIPVFTTQLDRARKAADESNIRSGYAVALSHFSMAASDDDLTGLSVEDDGLTGLSVDDDEGLGLLVASSSVSLYLQKDGSVKAGSGANDYECEGTVTSSDDPVNIGSNSNLTWNKGSKVWYTYTDGVLTIHFSDGSGNSGGGTGGGGTGGGGTGGESGGDVPASSAITVPSSIADSTANSISSAISSLMSSISSDELNETMRSTVQTSLEGSANSFKADLSTDLSMIATGYNAVTTSARSTGTKYYYMADGSVKSLEDFKDNYSDYSANSTAFNSTKGQTSYQGQYGDGSYNYSTATIDCSQSLAGQTLTWDKDKIPTYTYANGSWSIAFENKGDVFDYWASNV